MSMWRSILAAAERLARVDVVEELLAGLVERTRGVWRAFSPEDGAAAGVDNTKSIAFTIGVIALSAKMARADGEVTAAEINAFHEIFQVPPGEERNVDRVFDLARRDTAGYESYARGIARLFREGDAVLEQLLGGLFHIAKADGKVPESELAFIRRVAEIFGFDERAFERIRRSHLGLGDCLDDPFCVLGLTWDADEATIRAAYRRLSRENHPDALVAAGLPAEAVALANEKMAAINAAYDEVLRRHRQLASRAIEPVGVG